MFFHQKYKPQCVADLVIAKANVRERIERYANGSLVSHLVLFGPAGTGKSATAEVIAKQRTGDMFHWVQFLEGANFTNGDLTVIANSWAWQRTQGVSSPLVVINEIDMLGDKFLPKLRAFIDTHQFGQLIGTTNNLHLLDKPLADRFDQVSLPPVDEQVWLSRAQQILKSEGVSKSDQAVLELLIGCDVSSIRDVLSILEDTCARLRS